MAGRINNGVSNKDKDKNKYQRLKHKNIEVHKWFIIFRKLKDIGWSDISVKGYNRYLKCMGFMKKGDLALSSIEHYDIGTSECFHILDKKRLAV